MQNINFWEILAKNIKQNLRPFLSNQTSVCKIYTRSISVFLGWQKHSLGVSAFPKGRFRRVYSAPSAEGGFFPPSWIEATSSANSLSNPNSCQCVCVWKAGRFMETSHLGGYHWVPLKGGNRCEASEVYNMLCIFAEAQHLLRCRSVVLHHQKGKVLTITQGLAVQVAWNSSTRHNNASFLTGWRAKGISVTLVESPFTTLWVSTGSGYKQMKENCEENCEGTSQQEEFPQPSNHRQK